MNLDWYNFKQTVKKYMGLSFNYKTPKIYFHKEWNENNIEEIKIKIDKLRIKLNGLKKQKLK
tara:strand:- start:369 stop:554 length:186 start_codon:yes stop_codon:yes gene_type:complete